MTNTRGHSRSIDGLTDGSLGPGTYYMNNLRLDEYTTTAASWNTSAINDWLGLVDDANGGRVWAPQAGIAFNGELDNRYNRVLVQGSGMECYHDTTAIQGTSFVAVSAGAMLRHRSPYGVGNPKLSGGGWIDCVVDANGVALQLLEVDSINGGSYDVYLKNAVGTFAAVFKAGRSLIDLAEAADIQLMQRCRIRGRQLDSVAAQAAGCVKFVGSSNANVSLNRDIILDFQHTNGDMLDAISADSNIFTALHSAASGTGRPFIFRGPTASAPVGGSDNLIVQSSATNAGRAEGTDTVGVTAGITNTILFEDSANSTPAPTAGTGSHWMVTGSNAITRGAGMTKTVFATTVADAIAQRALLTTETYRNHNTSDAHEILLSSSASWTRRIVNATGDLEDLRLTGSGKRKLPDSEQVKFGTVSITSSKSAWGFFTNGWQYLPSGMLFQWGLNNVGAGTTRISFPVTFPTNMLCFLVTSGHTTPATVWAVGNYVSKSQLDLVASSATAAVWIALGY